MHAAIPVFINIIVFIIRFAYYRGAVGALLVYDVTKRSSFENCEQWLKELRDNCVENISICLVGNKIDLTKLRAVATEEGKHLASRHGISFFETSAQANTNVDLAFSTVVQECFKAENIKKSQSMNTKNTSNISISAVQKEQKSGCC